VGSDLLFVYVYISLIFFTSIGSIKEGIYACDQIKLLFVIKKQVGYRALDLNITGFYALARTENSSSVEDFVNSENEL
jgi:hypothetical protein